MHCNDTESSSGEVGYVLEFSFDEI